VIYYELLRKDSVGLMVIECTFKLVLKLNVIQARLENYLAAEFLTPAQFLKFFSSLVNPGN
jgi:hypothetical protein